MTTSPTPTLMDAAALSSLTDKGRLRLAIPNKGRLMEPTIALLRDAGISFEDGTRSLFARVEEYPIDILSVRTDDIAEFVADGVADLGITGTNLLVEAEVDLPIVLELGYGRCRLEAAVPNDHPAQGSRTSPACASRPATRAAPGAPSPTVASRSRSCPSAARWRSPPAWASRTPSWTSCRPAARWP